MPEKFPEKTLDYGSAIRRLRKERSMTSEALAGAAEVSPSYLSEVERGLKRPSTDVLAKLARAFGMLPSQLLEFIEALTAGPHLSALSIQPPQVRQLQARTRAQLDFPIGGPLSEETSTKLRQLLTVAQNLGDDDLTALLNLARHLLRKSKNS